MDAEVEVVGSYFLKKLDLSLHKLIQLGRSNKLCCIAGKNKLNWETSQTLLEMIGPTAGRAATSDGN